MLRFFADTAQQPTAFSFVEHVRTQPQLPYPTENPEIAMADEKVSIPTGDTSLAMGFKMNAKATFVWQKTVARERKSRKQWIDTFLPDVAAEEAAAVDKYKAAQAAARVGPPRTGARALLYDGVSKDGQGRVAYLKARRAMTPHERCGGQVQPPTGAQLVGWRLNQPVPKSPGLQNFAHTPTIMRDMYRSTGGSNVFAQHRVGM
jgi:hypothetical protein